MRSANPDTTALIEQRVREAAARGEKLEPRRVWVSYDEISPSLVRAVVVGEDQNFYRHTGLDLRAIRRAFKFNRRAGRTVTGASTINQQLAKNLFFSESRSTTRKLREAVAALGLDLILGKRRVLELYLNLIEWGDGIYGAEAAARHYCRTAASDLNVEQAAFLAAMIPSPRRLYNPDVNPERVTYRRDLILASLADDDEIDESTLRRIATRTVMPAFPDDARARSATGAAVARVNLDAEGRVMGVDVLASPDASIREAVAAAVRQWEFKPPPDNRAVPFRGKLTFYYKIENGEALVRNPLIKGR